MVSKILFLVLLIDFLFAKSSCSEERLQFYDFIYSIQNSSISCSDVFGGSTSSFFSSSSSSSLSSSFSQRFYLNESNPILTKIFSNFYVSEFFRSKWTLIESILRIFNRYLDEINFVDISQRQQTNYLQYLLKSLKATGNIVSVGLCLNNASYHSEFDFIDDNFLCNNVYLLKRNSTINIDIRDVKKIIIKNNNKHYDNGILHSVHWQKLACSTTPKLPKFSINFILTVKLSAIQTAITFFIDFNISDYRLDQCEMRYSLCKDSSWCNYYLFPGRKPFELGNYYCQCRNGFYNDQMNGTSPGYEIEEANLEQNFELLNKYDCRSCKSGCETCNSSDPCMISYNPHYIRSLPLAFQSFCITLCIVTGVIIFHRRRTRVIKNSHWVLLELFLVGAILIYCTIINLYITPNEITCAIQPFLREVGFVLMYGVLYVKVYRVLCSFQSRKAQRVYVRDQDILRYLGVLVIICFGHLLAWLATGFDHKKSDDYDTFSETKKLDKRQNYLKAVVCRAKYWDVVSYFYETFLLLLTIYYCKCVKSAPSEYGEVRYITIAVINEFIISLLVIIARMSLTYSLHPNYIFLIYFIHCHATATISAILLIGPKLWYLYRPPASSSGKPRLVPHTDSHIIQTQHKLNGDLDLVEINIADMDPETIRDELKRLYTQLEIYKTRAMRKDNPHVSRKRGGRKQRRFSLQHFHKKHHTTSVHEDEPSKISEDSGGNSGGEDVTLTSTSTKQT